MTDIVERLHAIARDAPGWPERGGLLEAADEIERLRAENEQLREEWNELVQVVREGRRALEHKP